MSGCPSCGYEFRAWVTPEQVSGFTGLDLSRLTNQRSSRIVFPHYPISGTRKVVYDRLEVDAVITAGRVGTVDEGLAAVGLGGMA